MVYVCHTCVSSGCFAGLGWGGALWLYGCIISSVGGEDIAVHLLLYRNGEAAIILARRGITYVPVRCKLHIIDAVVHSDVNATFRFVVEFLRSIIMFVMHYYWLSGGGRQRARRKSRFIESLRGTAVQNCFLVPVFPVNPGGF